MTRSSMLVFLLVLLIAAGLAGCKDKDEVKPIAPPPPPPPVEGTILSSTCDEYTLVEEVADGKGGSTERRTEQSEECGWNPPTEGTVLESSCDGYTLVEKIADGAYGSTERVTPRSPECGWNPPPRGELAETRCDAPYTLVNVYHDGEYGFYEEAFPDSEECGYIPPRLDVQIDNTYGDRFKPVVVTVDYTVQGEPAEWTYEIEAGRAVKEGNTLYIYGTGEGNSVDFILYINDESFTYQLKKEPVCEITEGFDCQGYRQFGGHELIYYGEDDTQVVTVEVVITDYWGEKTQPEHMDIEGKSYQRALNRVAKWNEMLAKDGIYIEFKLVGAYWWNNTSLRSGENFMDDLPTDIGLGRGTTYPNTCGVAYPNKTFRTPGFGFSACSYATDLHELGHAIGLAHGPNNSAYPQSGYIFPQFGHGDYGMCGGRTDDIMSYGNKAHFFNSRQDCAERFPDRPYTGPAGDRTYADSAYHWNRVRYSLSLIHDEHAQNEKSPTAKSRRAKRDDDRPLIID